MQTFVYPIGQRLKRGASLGQIFTLLWRGEKVVAPDTRFRHAGNCGQETSYPRSFVYLGWWLSIEWGLSSDQDSSNKETNRIQWCQTLKGTCKTVDSEHGAESIGLKLSRGFSSFQWNSETQWNIVKHSETPWNTVKHINNTSITRTQCLSFALCKATSTAAKQQRLKRLLGEWWIQWGAASCTVCCIIESRRNSWNFSKARTRWTRWTSTIAIANVSRCDKLLWKLVNCQLVIMPPRLETLFWDLFGAVRFSVATCYPTMLPNDVAQRCCPTTRLVSSHRSWDLVQFFPGLCQCQCWKSRLSRGLLEGQQKKCCSKSPCAKCVPNVCQMCAKCVPNDAPFVRFGFLWSPAYPVCHKYILAITYESSFLKIRCDFCTTK